MHRLIQLVARFCLWLTSVAIPVVIAACYGAPFRYSKTGQVIDAESREGINGIQVTCVQAGQEQSVAFSAEDGTFWLDYDIVCDLVRAEDVDGEDNGGYYQPRSLPFDQGADDLVIEMRK